MKMFFTLITLCLSLAALAQGGGDSVGSGDPEPTLLTVEYPASPMMEVPMERKIEVVGNGRVVETVSTYTGRPTGPEVSFRLLTILSPAQINKISQCSSKLSEMELDVQHNDLCMDDAGTYYRSFYGVKLFAASFCGQVQSVQTKCAKEMVKLLDGLSNLKR